MLKEDEHHTPVYAGVGWSFYSYCRQPDLQVMDGQGA